MTLIERGQCIPVAARDASYQDEVGVADLARFRAI